MSQHRLNVVDLALLLICAASLGLGEAAWADAAQDCRSGTPDSRVVGCSALLAEARTPRQQAIALDGRCKANNDRSAFLEGISDCTSAIRADDDYPYSYFNRGIAQAGLNNHTAAIADFSRAHNLRPNFAWILVNRAKSHASLRNTEAAIRDYEEALRLKPDNEEAKVNLALLRSGGTINPSAMSIVPPANSLCGSVGCN
ncbi:tetratricopeptide repeat protein [Methylobacterium nigriterrae]|uniref:tetratricopeptide repeat protein n=1 Tax=Methylobacterium nigriterrae TaxID=3127512 RepID=UPI00301394BD